MKQKKQGIDNERLCSFVFNFVPPLNQINDES